jgi:serine/threonine protein phosphatase PrpC
VKLCERPDGGATGLIAHVGDSRVYRYTTAGELVQCTLDDSEFGADWDLQRRLGEVVVPTTLIEFMYFEQRHILDRCLGSPRDRARVWEVDVDEGDVLLALTDGVTDNLTFSEVRDLIGNGGDEPDRIARRLVEAAHARSQQEDHGRAKVDDITAVVARVAPAVS